MSLHKFVSHKLEQDRRAPRGYKTHSPGENEMGTAMRALRGWIRMIKKNRGGKVELTLGDSKYAWNAMKSPSKLFTL